MRLSIDEVRHIALLSRIGTTDDEIETMRGQLSNILDHFDVLQKVDTEDVDPTGHSVDLKSVMREDESTPSQPAEEILANVPRREGDYVRVRSVLE